MSASWIKMRNNLDTNPRVIAMASMLDVPELHVIGMLWKVWAWADQHSVDGNAIYVTDVTLDRFVSVTGFAKAMRCVGWLEGENNKLSFPKFCEHNGQTAKKRAETNVRVAKHRNAKSVTREEKIREDKSIKKVSKKDGEHPSFPDWYAVYPLKKARGSASKAYGKAIDLLERQHGDAACAFLLERTKALAPELLANAEFIPHPATWLNAQRWDDQPKPSASSSRVLTKEELENWRPS